MNWKRLELLQSNFTPR
uniref:Uncharacterized protein n=1 Tax=Arundo donax TaxID=35708 RepID=A0A0A9BFA3_ARUDO